MNKSSATALGASYGLHVHFAIARCREPFSADGAAVGMNAEVNTEVAFEVAVLSCCLLTYFALVYVISSTLRLGFRPVHGMVLA